MTTENDSVSRSVASDPQPGDLYRDKQGDATFEVQAYDRKRAYVYGVRSDYGSWSVFRPNFDMFYERVTTPPSPPVGAGDEHTPRGQSDA